MQFNSTETNEQKVDSSNINLPLLFLGFLFLVVILLFNGINQWRSEKQLFKQDIVRSLDDFSRQSGLLAQASYHTNLIFVRSHIELLSNAINDPKQYSEHLWTEANLAIFNLTGLVLLNEYGRSVHRQGPDLNRDEVDDIWQNIKSFGSESGMFILRYGKDGGFYFFNRYQAANGKLFYFVSRRSYSALSSIIFENKFQGFEVILIDTRYNSIMMREGYYADSSSQPLVDDRMRHRVLYQAQIPQTYLAVAAIPKPVNLISELWRYLRQPVLIICVFIVLSSSLLWMLRRQEMTAQQHMRRRHLIEQRANKALNAIDDAFISTDSLGFVTYANPKGEQLLREQGHQQVIGEPLSVLWPSPQALWNRGLTVQELEDLNKHNFQLNINLSGRERIFEQMCNPLLEGNEISGMVWLLRDVTEEILAHRALEESQQRYKILFDEAGVGHCLFDIDEFKRKGGRLHVVSVNESAVQMAGAPDKNYFIAHFTELTDGPNNAFRLFLQRAITLRQHFTEFELPITTFMGEKHYLWVSISLRSGIDGQVLASFVDITEQKRQNEQIREREAFWGKIMDAMPDIVYVAELDDQPHSHVIYRNRTLGQLLGYEHDNSDGNNWMTYADRDESQRLKKVLLRIKKLKMGETFEYVSRFFHKNGSIRVIKFRDTPFLIDEKGEVVRYIGSIRDVTEDVEQQEKILESERRYRLLAENINDIIWATDLKLNFNFISSSVTQILGYKPDELLREGVASIFKESDIALISRQIKGILNNAQANNEHSFKPNMVIRKDLVVSHKQGMEMLLEVQASPLWNDSGELIGVIGTCRDVGESRRVEQELQLAAEVFANSNEGIMITDTSHKIVKLNAAFCNMTGYTPSDVLGKAPDFIVSRRKHDRRFLKTLDIALASDGYWQGEIAYEKADGEIRTGWAGVSAVRDKDYEIQSLIIILSDITERKASEERIHKLAYFDALTGLPNRTQLNERLGLMLKSGEKNNQSVALLFIDLDRFKPINDSMGHPAGDLVLKEVALRLQSCVKKHDIICRMGGDEFTIAIGNQISADAAAETSVRVAERILKELSRPYVLNDREVFLSGSIGVAIYPHDAST
ncbi:MAG: PAS domain S-box protein, partial [Venatoribacter sp.]